MNTKDINHTAQQCSNFIVKDNDEYIVDIIVDMTPEARKFIFNIIDKDSREDVVCPLFQNNKQDLEFLKSDLPSKETNGRLLTYDGFIYKNNKPNVKERLTLVYTDMKAALVHFIESHLDENEMNEKIVYSVVEDFLTEDVKKWMLDRALGDTLNSIANTLKKHNI